MPEKVIVEYSDLDECISDLNSFRLRTAIQVFDNWLREQIKYEETLTGIEKETLLKAREKLIECVNYEFSDLGGFP